MAESLGAAVLTVSVDDAQLKAGLQAAERQAQVSGQNIQQAFTKSGKPLQTAANGLQFYIDAQGRAREASGRFLSIAQQQAIGLEGVGRSAGAAGTRLGDFTDALAGLGIGAAFTGFLKSSIDSAIELETITKKLSNTLGSDGAGQALSFTRGLSDELGLSFKTLANSFGGFTAAASAANVPLEQQKELFAAVSTAAQALGLSNDEINGSLLALQQIAAKGTVQAEELRGQLGERLPIALSAAARGLGITQQELLKLVESGGLAASDFFPALSRGLNELTANAGGLPTTAQNLQKLGNAWDELQTQLGNSLLPVVVPQIENLTKALQGLQVGSNANQLGLGGLFGNLGLVPDIGIKAVAEVKQLEKQFELTAEQARALFFDAAKLEGLKLTSTGFLPDARGLERVFARLPELAQRFKSQNTDVTTELQRQQAEAAAVLREELKRTDNISNLESKLKELQQQRKLLPIDSDQFQKVNQEITAVQARLDKLNKSSTVDLSGNLRDQLASAKTLVEQIATTQSSIGSGSTPINIDDKSLKAAIDQLLSVENKLNDIDGKKATITVEQINAGVQNGTLTNNFSNLERRSQAAQSALDNAAFGTDEFAKALRAAREAALELRERRDALDIGGDKAQAAREAEARQREARRKASEQGVAEQANRVREAFARVETASNAVAQAQQGLRSALEGAFDLLTDEQQRRLESQARQDIEQAIRAGLFDPSTRNLSGSEAISAAQQARSIEQAQENLANANQELITAQQNLTQATLALAQKNWQVNVAVNANTGASSVQLG